MYERSNSDGARLSARKSGFGLSGGMGDNGNVNVEGGTPGVARMAISPSIMQLFRPKPGAAPASSFMPMPDFGGGDGGLTLGPGESVPPGEGDPGMAPLVEMMEPERPVWLIPAIALGGLAVIGGGIWFFTRKKD
jgi:hypothetical protein